MKYLFCAVLGLIFAISSMAKEAIRLGDGVYHLAFEDSNDEGALKEFLPAGETLENWTRMVAVRNLKKIRSPKDHIMAMAQNYRTQYPHMQFAVFEKKGTKEWAIDFIIYPLGQDSGHVEWNYFQAGKVRGVKGIVLNQYVARKPFNGSLEPVFKSWNLRDYRSEILGMLMSERFEIVDLPETEVQTTTSVGG